MFPAGVEPGLPVGGARAPASATAGGAPPPQIGLILATGRTALIFVADNAPHLRLGGAFAQALVQSTGSAVGGYIMALCVISLAAFTAVKEPKGVDLGPAADDPTTVGKDAAPVSRRRAVAG